MAVDPPRGTLCARWSTPVTDRETLPVRQLLHTPAGETVLALGQEITGGFRLSLCVPRGRKVRLQCGEILQNGNFYRGNLRTAKAEYVYISDGNPHTLEPRFTFYGYRYVKVEGVDGLQPGDFTGLCWYSELPGAGTLSTGHALVNRLIANAQWGQTDNFLDVPTDCPQRDERMGWTGDAQVFAPTACYQRDCYAFFAKYLHDLAAEQAARGGQVPNVVPSFGVEGCSAAWGDAACIIPWTLYEFYGDVSILQAQYPSMKAWVDYITALDGQDDGWRRQFHYGDWLPLDAANPDDPRGGTDVGLVASTQYRYCAQLTARAARVLGKPEEAARYEALAEAVLASIRREFFTPNGRCAVPTQTALLLSLVHGLAPDPARAARDLLDRLAADGGTLRTGFVGTPLLCPTLCAIGAENQAFSLLLYEGYPGWLYAVKLGATTIWERWNSVGPDGTIAENGMNSLNHYAYGSVVGWMYRDVAGLSPAEPGFRRARLAPHICEALSPVQAEYRSAAGIWRIGWTVAENGDVTCRGTVPFGCTATLALPYGGGERELGAGAFSVTYTPDRPLHNRFTTAMPVAELLADPRVRARLAEVEPRIAQLPPSLRGRSIQELARIIPGGEALVKMFDAVLAEL